MFQNRLQQFECDQCQKLIQKSQVVIFHKDKHFCSPKCLLDWHEGDKDWRQKEVDREYVADLGED
jgi:hypothetical protein